MSNNQYTGKDGRRANEGRRTNRRKLSALVRNAREQLEEVVGVQTESTSALTTDDDGWTVRVEVLELERVPDTTSILATYSVQLDQNGDLLSYERVNRYARGQIRR